MPNQTLPQSLAKGTVGRHGFPLRQAFARAWLPLMVANPETADFSSNCVQ
jgi:hypothetical protein